MPTACNSNMVDRERFYVAHDQTPCRQHHRPDLGSQYRRLGQPPGRRHLSSSYLDFVRPGAANFPDDYVSLVDPDRGLYGLLTTQQQTARIDNEALSFEDRLKLTRTFALIGGLRVEHIGLDRNSTDVAGLEKRGFPFSTVLGRRRRAVSATLGRPFPGLTFFSQYATGADIVGQQHLPARPDPAARPDDLAHL